MKFGRKFGKTVSTKRGKNYNISTNYHISAISGGVADGRDDAELLKKKISKSENFWSLLNFYK